MWTVLAIVWVVPLLMLVLWGVYEGMRVGDDQALWRAWTRVLDRDPPSPEELADLLGPAVECVQRAAVDEDAPRGLAPPSSELATAVREVHSRSLRATSVLLTWTVGYSCINEPVRERRLPVDALRLRQLRLLAVCERPMAFLGHVFRVRPATHMITLRWSLRLLVRALRAAERAEPARRAQLLADVAADFALIRGDIVASHAAVLGPFLRWRATQPPLRRAGQREEEECGKDSGWY